MNKRPVAKSQDSLHSDALVAGKHVAAEYAAEIIAGLKAEDERFQAVPVASLADAAELRRRLESGEVIKVAMPNKAIRLDGQGDVELSICS